MRTAVSAYLWCAFNHGAEYPTTTTAEWVYLAGVLLLLTVIEVVVVYMFRSFHRRGLYLDALVMIYLFVVVLAIAALVTWGIFVGGSHV